MLGKKIYVANIFIPLIIGTIIYFVYRPDTYISIFLRQVLENFGWKSQSTLEFNNSTSNFSTFLRNFGCDILWAYSLVFSAYFFAEKSAKSLIRVFVLCLGFEIFVEFLQYSIIFTGTFDIMDIIVEFVATLVAVGILFKSSKGEKLNEKELDS